MVPRMLFFYGGEGPAQRAKKYFFYTNIYLFLTHIARCCNFRDVSFDFEPDAKEMNKIFSKFDLSDS